MKHIDEYWCILCGNHRQLDLVCERISKFSEFSQHIRACQKHELAPNLLDTLGEVFTNNFLTAM